jgi:hypothetical protein
MRDDVGTFRSCQIDLARNQVLHERGCAAIGNELEGGANGVCKVSAPDPPRAAHPDTAEGSIRVGFKPGDELCQVVGRQTTSSNEDLGRRCQQRDRRQVRQQVKRQRISRPAEHVRIDVADAHRVAVRLRAYHAGNPDAAACSRHILDDDGLPERHLHALANQPRDGVGRPSRRGRDDNGDGTRGIPIRSHACGAGCSGDGDEGDSQTTVHRICHPASRTKIAKD